SVTPVVGGPFLEERDEQHAVHEHHDRGDAENEVGALQAPRLRHGHRRLEQRDLHRQRRDQGEGGEVMQEGHCSGCIHTLRGGAVLIVAGWVFSWRGVTGQGGGITERKNSAASFETAPAFSPALWPAP